MCRMVPPTSIFKDNSDDQDNVYFVDLSADPTDLADAEVIPMNLYTVSDVFCGDLVYTASALHSSGPAFDLFASGGSYN